MEGRPQGEGPGEYQIPYRITPTPAGTLLVFDLATRDVTTLSQDGRFVSRSHLPLNLPYVDEPGSARSIPRDRLAHSIFAT